MDWDNADLPAWGSAKDAQVIVCVEQAGSWSDEAVADAGFAEPAGAKLYVIRQPGAHAQSPERRTVLVSGGFGQVPWLVTGSIDQGRVHDFLASDVASPATWEDFGLQPSTDSALIVCTNGKKDQCCAIRGRDVALAGSAAAPARVWEVSHLGGHRFAPTAIHLPTGQTFGRLSAADGAALAAAGRSGTLPAHLFDTAHHRGRVDLSPAQRVAETWWRQEAQSFALVPPVVFNGGVRQCDADVVMLPDGRQLAVREVPTPEPMRVSCAKGPQPSAVFTADLVD